MNSLPSLDLMSYWELGGYPILLKPTFKDTAGGIYRQPTTLQIRKEANYPVLQHYRSLYNSLIIGINFDKVRNALKSETTLNLRDPVTWKGLDNMYGNLN